jgi:hypothetical protein
MMNRREVLRTLGQVAGAATVARMLPACDGVEQPELGTLESELVTDPVFAKVSSDSSWGTSWTKVVSGRWTNSVYPGLFLYDKITGTAEIWDTFAGSRFGLPIKQLPNWRPGWTQIVSAYWADAAGAPAQYSGLLCYDAPAGSVTLYNTDGSGGLTTLTTKATRTTWTNIAVGFFLSGEFSGIFLYSQSEGYGEVWRVSQYNTISVTSTYSLPTNISHVTVGQFGLPVSAADCAGLFFYFGSSGLGQFWRSDGAQLFYSSGTGAGALPTNCSFVAAGNFGSGISNIQDLLFVGGDGLSAGRLSFRYGTSVTSFDELDPSSTGFRTGSMIVPGNFEMAVADDHWLSDGPIIPGNSALETERRAALRQWRGGLGAFCGFMAYDKASGIGECFRRDPRLPAIPPVEGYATSTSSHSGQTPLSSGSVLPGETVNFHISTTQSFGACTIDIYRGATLVIQLTSKPASSGPLYRSRTAYRDGAQWPAAASLTVPATWKSGLYFARITGATGSLDVPFVVRSNVPGQGAKLLVVIPDATYEAYNLWGGRSSYGWLTDLGAGDTPWCAPGPSGYGIGPYGMTLSFARGFTPNYDALSSNRWTFRILQFVKWLELQGISADYCTARDLDIEAPSSNYRVVAFPGHHEYWSRQMRLNLESYASAGGNLAFFSGNVCWFQVRFDYQHDQMICYRRREFDPKFQAADSYLTSCNWHDPPVNWPSDNATGVRWSYDVIGELLSYGLNTSAQTSWVTNSAIPFMNDPKPAGNPPAFGLFTDGGTQSVAGLAYQAATETDKLTSLAPVGFTTLASIQRSGGVAAQMGIFSRSGTGAVFTASSSNWALGLSQNTSWPWSAMDQVTLNVVAGLSDPPKVVTCGVASDVASSPNGALWIIDSYPVTGGSGIWYWNGSSFSSGASFGALRIAIDPNGNPWVCDSSRTIKRRDSAGNWAGWSGQARDIGIGSNGQMWVIGNTLVYGNDYSIHYWNGSSWPQIDGGGVAITVDVNGDPWVRNYGGELWHRVGGANGYWQNVPTPDGNPVGDLAAGVDGTLAITCWSAQQQRWVIYRRIGSRWARLPGVATSLSIGKDGLWVGAPRNAVASSSESTYVASRAIDGRTDTRWSSVFSDPQWIYVDLGVISYIRRVVLWWETAYGRAYQIQVSNDAINWTTKYSTSTGDGGIDDIRLNEGTSGRYVRMYGTQRGTSWGYSLWDFFVDCFPQ